MDMIQTFDISMSLLIQAIEEQKDAKDFTANTALGEIGINGVVYQIQLSFTPTKKLWFEEEDGVIFTKLTIDKITQLK